MHNERWRMASLWDGLDKTHLPVGGVLGVSLLGILFDGMMYGNLDIELIAYRKEKKKTQVQISYSSTVMNNR
jgi:orotate phosphoribosyltransferase-like protein